MNSKRLITLLLVSVLAINAAISKNAKFSSLADAASKIQSRLPAGSPGGISGYINVNQTANANMFYWFFPAQTQDPEAPLVMWMTGGPGCSSELALFFENGPFQLTTDLQVVNNPYSWNKFASLLYIDQPVGTGFSYADSDYVHDETVVAADVYTFLQGWFKQYPYPYLKNDFYIVGESYGGHYVPAVAAKVAVENDDESNTYINLKGVGIGNGLVDPLIQDGSYAVFGYKYGLINESTYAQMNQTYADCVVQLSNDEWDAAQETCGSLFGTVLSSDPGVNYYDVKLRCDPPPLCYDLTNITNYLNTPSVQQSLGVNPFIEWEACNFQVNGGFAVDEEQSYAMDLPILLNKGITVFVYSGMLDLICNYIGGDMWTRNMQWPGQTGFNDQELVDWLSENGTVLGHFRYYQGLTFMEVEGAGHMVPHDQPEVALTLLQMIINGKP